MRVWHQSGERKQRHTLEFAKEIAFAYYLRSLAGWGVAPFCRFPGNFKMLRWKSKVGYEAYRCVCLAAFRPSASAAWGTKALFFGILVVLALLGTNAQASEIEGRFGCEKELSKVQANSLLTSVQNAYKSSGSLKAQFNQESRIAALDDSEQASGTVYFKKPGKMRWVYELPEPQVFLVRDETVYLFQPELSQLVVETLKDVLLAEMPVAFLMGIGELENEFRIERACDSGGRLLLSLVPKHQTSETDNEAPGDLRSFELLVNRESHLPAGARVVDVGGNVTAILLSDVHSNDPAVTEADFAVSFPAGVDIDDRRRAS